MVINHHWLNIVGHHDDSLIYPILALYLLLCTTWISLVNDLGKDYYGPVCSLQELAIFAENTGKFRV